MLLDSISRPIIPAMGHEVVWAGGGLGGVDSFGVYFLQHAVIALHFRPIHKEKIFCFNPCNYRMLGRKFFFGPISNFVARPLLTLLQRYVFADNAFVYFGRTGVVFCK